MWTREFESQIDVLTPVAKIYNDGGKYTGTFKNNLRHGFGKYEFSNGDMFEGIW